MKDKNTIEIVEEIMESNVKTFVNLRDILSIDYSANKFFETNVVMRLMISKESYRDFHYGLYQLLKELKKTDDIEMKWCHPSPKERIIYEKFRKIVDERRDQAPHYLDCESKQELKQLVADFQDSSSGLFKELNLEPFRKEIVTIEKHTEFHDKLIESIRNTHKLLRKLKKSLNCKRVDELINLKEKASSDLEYVSFLLEMHEEYIRML